MSMQGRKNLQARKKQAIKRCLSLGQNIMANILINEHEVHKALRKKPMKFQFNQTTPKN